MTANVSTVNLSDGRVVTLSFGVPVAVFVPRGTVLAHPPGHTPEGKWWVENELPYGYLKTDRAYSSTTSRHANLLARQNGSTAKVVPHAVFRQLVTPIETEA